MPAENDRNNRSKQLHFHNVQIDSLGPYAQHEVHGLLGQRAVATAELPLGSASVSARGEASAAFGPQGEGAIEGSYLDYRRASLDAHETISPYNRFASCGVAGYVEGASSLSS